jgi:hypothetical protein
MHTTTSTGLEIDATEHTNDSELTIYCKHEVAIWGYMMTQHNLKAGVCRFGERGVSAAMSDLTQLHIMDLWKVIDPAQLT